MNLITAAEVIAISFNDKNFLPGKILDSHIQVAQEGFIRPAIGVDLYTTLTATTPAGDNATLVDNYIKPALAWYVRYVMLPEITAHASNAGVQVIQGQGATQASDKQVGLVREQAKANGDVLMDVAIRYIKTNSVKFPQYDYCDTSRSVSRVLGGVVFRRGTTRRTDKESGLTPILMTGVVKSVQDIRRITSHTHSMIVICAGNNFMYEYDALSEAVDNGSTIIKPDNSAVGRWVFSKELQMVNL